MLSFKKLVQRAASFVGATAITLATSGKAMAYNPAVHVQSTEAQASYALFKTCKVAGLELDHQRAALQQRLSNIDNLNRRVNELHLINRDLARPASDVPASDYAPHRIPVNNALIQQLEHQKQFQSLQANQAYQQYVQNQSMAQTFCPKY
jgi:flagellar biosynthesis GTPase FlhF